MAYILPGVSKRLVDIDDEALAAAQAELGTATIRATVNEALRRAGSQRVVDVDKSIGVLAAAALSDRADAWH
jgi:Arc/MetJ family transcription regulator